MKGPLAKCFLMLSLFAVYAAAGTTQGTGPKANVVGQPDIVQALPVSDKCAWTASMPVLVPFYVVPFWWPLAAADRLLNLLLHALLQHLTLESPVQAMSLIN